MIWRVAEVPAGNVRYHWFNHLLDEQGQMCAQADGPSYLSTYWRTGDTILNWFDHFGERWAQHWLDVIRWAETNGSESNMYRKNAWIYVDIRGIDVGTYVKMAQQAVREKVKLPPGYSMVWSGQYEYMVRAQKRLMIVVPMTLVIIFLLLYFNFKHITESLIVMLSVPFSLTGGLW